MLPGHVAGFYDYDQCHIDLQSLAEFAQCQIFVDRAIAIDLNKNRVICQNRPPVNFDLLSIDIGSTLATLSIPGAAEYAIPAKPVPEFLANWKSHFLGNASIGSQLDQRLRLSHRLKRLYASQRLLAISLSPKVFAAGDIAAMVNYPRPKAGVFAVRQDKPLFENLQQFLLAKPIKPKYFSCGI